MLPAARRPVPLAFRFLRPRALYLAALGATLAFFVAVHGDSQAAAERRLALHGGAPQPVDLAGFDAARSVGAADEVQIEAQVDVTLPLLVHFRTGGELRRALAFPLLAVGAQRGPGGEAPAVLGFFHIEVPIRPHEVLDPSRLLPDFERVGAIGPVVVVNGTLNAPGPVVSGMRAALEERGRAVADNLTAIALFPGGRVAALSQMPLSPWRSVCMGLAALLLALGFALSRVLPVLDQRYWRGRMAGRGRRRGDGAPLPETDKGRRRLVPLASPASDRTIPARLIAAFRSLPEGRIKSWR